MCNCVNIKMGSYDNQSAVHTPDGKLVGIDNCILDEIKNLWELEIVTVESCCGHNITQGFIAVDQNSIWKMRALGYEPFHIKAWPYRRDEYFKPKSIPKIKDERIV